VGVERRLSGACTVSLLAAALLGPAAAVSAQTTDVQALRQEIEQLRKEFEAVQQQYGQRLSDLESRLGTSAASTPTAQDATQQPTVEVPPGAAGAGGPTGALPIYGTTSAASKIFNPDIAVIGNFLGAVGENDVSPAPAFEMNEAEATFQAVVDPYARADFFFSFSPEGVEIEEGYLTFPTLPGGLLAKVGKFKQQFGKVNTLHPHQLSWVDEPLVLQNLLGGDEAMARSRRPELVADAAHAVVTRPSRECTGNLFLAEDVLAEDGITDMAAYSYGDQTGEPIPDLFVD
jgi:hypothetical protein